MTDDLDAVLNAVGPRLRAMRKQRGVTLDALARATGISASTLSRLESGQRRATLELLLPLAKAHRVPLDELVGAPATGDPRVHAKPIHRNGQTWLPLSGNPGGISAFKIVVPVERKPAVTLSQNSHEGYEWMYVLSGRARLALGAEDFELVAGEAAEFDTRVAHAFVNAGPEPLELLIMFSAQGERVHLRARTTKPAGPPTRG